MGGSELFQEILLWERLLSPALLPRHLLGDGGGPSHIPGQRGGAGRGNSALPAEPNKLWVGTQGSHAGLRGRLDSWGVRGVVCRVAYTPLFPGSSQRRHVCGPSPPQSYSILIWGARGLHRPRVRESGRGRCADNGLWGGSCRETADGQGTSRFSPPKSASGKSATESQLGRTFLAIPRGELVWEVLLEMRAR